MDLQDANRSFKSSQNEIYRENSSQTFNQIYQKHIQDQEITDDLIQFDNKQIKDYSISSNALLKNTVQQEQDISGFLLKKSPNFFAGWQKRYCVVSKGKFYYFKDKDDIHYKGVLDFRLMTIGIMEIKEGDLLIGFTVFIDGSDRQFSFKICEQKTDILKWINVIKGNIKYSLNCKINIIYDEKQLASTKNFWRDDRISLSQFHNEADTGDLLLFRGKTMRNKVQRFLTNDQYDHIGLLLRYNTGQLYLLESIGQQGVGLVSWSKFLQNDWHQTQDKLVYRKLEIDRTIQQIQKLEDFIKQTIGKKYKISAGKLIQRWKKVGTEDLERSDKTFFCSELIAASYKQMGLLPENITSASYWPGQFSAQQDLQLLQGKLAQEKLIDFSIYVKPIRSKKDCSKKKQ